MMQQLSEKGITFNASNQYNISLMSARIINVKPSKFIIQMHNFTIFLNNLEVLSIFYLSYFVHFCTVFLFTRASVGARVIKCKPFFFFVMVPGVPSGDRENWARESRRRVR